MAVRSPMQWSEQENGGFSGAPPDQLKRPPTAGAYGPEHVNVASQRPDPDSLLSFMRSLVRAYRESPELGWAELHVLKQPHVEVLAHECRWDDRRLLLVHNLGPEPRRVSLQIEGGDGIDLVDVLGEAPCTLDADGTVHVELDGYGFRWLRLSPVGTKRIW